MGSRCGENLGRLVGVQAAGRDALAGEAQHGPAGGLDGLGEGAKLAGNSDAVMDRGSGDNRL